jgi:hypothetical protein
MDITARFRAIEAEAWLTDNLTDFAFLVGKCEALADIAVELNQFEDEKGYLSASLHDLKERLDDLTIADAIQDISQAEPGRAEPSQAGPERKTFIQEYVSCGKERCKKCAGSGKGHGPYWYQVRYSHGKTIKKYIGKELPVTFQLGADEARYLPKPE